MTTEDPTFGVLLRDLRRRAGRSQQSLAEAAGISVDAVAALERGRRRAPRAFTVKALADAMQLDPQQSEALHRAAGSQAVATEPVADRLPAPVGPLVGRADDVASLAAALTGAPGRLVTLTGPGGIGKTRLALQVAHEVVPHFAGGVRWLPLDAVTESAALPALVVNALGIRGASGPDLLRSAALEIADRPVLLVLDSCEHLAAACADACATLLAQTTRLRLLVTSRERLRITGETTWPVAALEVPDDDCMPELLESYSATSLFLHHARQFFPGFTVTADEARTLAALCRRLDGLPLAVELAAARTAVLSVAEVASALDDGLDVLRSESRHRPARHQTMLSTLDWSYDLLSPAERTVFCRLAVFADGATMAAARVVCAAAGVRSRDVVGVVEALAAKSLVARRERVGAARIGLLDTVRRYALDRLRASGELAAAEAAHAAYFGALATRLCAPLSGDDQRSTLGVVDDEIGNFRRAISVASSSGNAELALQLTGSLWRWWYVRGHYAEGRSWCETALATPGPAAAPVRSKALGGAAMLAFLQCEYAVARTRLEQSLELYRAAGDWRGEAWALQRLGAVAREEGRYDDAEVLHSAGMAVLTAAGEPALARRELTHLVFVQWLRGSPTAAADHAMAALDAQREAGSDEGVVWGLLNFGAISLYGGDLPHARRLMTESLTLADDLGFSEGIAWAVNLLGVTALREGDIDRAHDLLTESLARHRALGDEWRTASVLETLAQVAVRRGDTALAGRLLGAGAAIRERIGAPVPGCEQAEHEAAVAAVRAVLGNASFDTAQLVGAAIPLDRLIAAHG